MIKVYILIANGFEEIEALAPADVLRRAGYDVQLVSVPGTPFVTGSHGISVKTDLFLVDVNVEDATMLVLPGGMPGTSNLLANERVKFLVKGFHEYNKWLAAICAAPMILGEMGLLEGVEATCYPGFEKHLVGATIVPLPVVTSGKIITARGVGASMAFCLEIVKNLSDEHVALELKKKMMVE